jgi:hypothetical protein
MTGKPGPHGEAAKCRNCGKSFDKGDEALFYRYSDNEDSPYSAMLSGHIHADCQLSKQLPCPYCKEQYDEGTWADHRATCKGKQNDGPVPARKGSIIKEAPYGIPKDKGGDNPENDAKMESCVDKVMAKGHDKSSAIAICKDSMGFTSHLAHCGTCNDSVVEHIEEDGTEFDEIKEHLEAIEEKIEDMNKEDAEFKEKLTAAVHEATGDDATLTADEIAKNDPFADTRRQKKITDEQREQANQTGDGPTASRTLTDFTKPRTLFNTGITTTGWKTVNGWKNIAFVEVADTQQQQSPFKDPDEEREKVEKKREESDFERGRATPSQSGGQQQKIIQ